MSHFQKPKTSIQRAGRTEDMWAVGDIWQMFKKTCLHFILKVALLC